MNNENEKEILLNPEEIQQLLEGGLYWKDIEPKLAPENSVTINRQLPVDNEEINPEPKAKHDQIEHDHATQDIVNNFIDSDEDKKVRAILLGESKIIKDRQIDLSHIQEISATSEPEAMQTEGDKKQNQDEVPEKEKNFFLDDTENVMLFSNEIDNNSEPFFKGWKLILLMIVVAALTFGFWFYFLGR
ncbi:MAG: hypothetical protein GX207_08580 [Peptococcaceae bacterium]|nr:hypothetical protein [Peptococcaceae bacterium]